MRAAAMHTTTLRRVQVAGFRSIRELDLTLGRTTLLIGANGAGKSNLLALFRMVLMLESESLGLFIGKSGQAHSNLYDGPKVSPAIELDLEAERDDGAASGYAARLEYAAADALVFATEEVRARRPNETEWTRQALGSGHAESRLRATARGPTPWPAKVVQQWLARMSFFHFHDTTPESRLRQSNQRVEDRYLRSDGRNLAAYLWRLSSSEDEIERAAFSRISRLVQQAAPSVKALEPTLIDPRHPDASEIRLDWIDRRDQRFGVHQLSDGTLRLIALITALSQPLDVLPTFVAIDEPELGLHPAAIDLLAGLVRSVAHRCQVILSTQSTELLDRFEASDVVVVENRDGDSRFVRQDATHLERWLRDDYKLSELYARNVLGGRP